MSILRTPVNYAEPLTDLAEVMPLRLRPEIVRSIDFPIGNLQPPDRKGKATGRVIRGNNFGAVLTQPNADYETCQHGTLTIHWSNAAFCTISFIERVRAWILISDTEVFDDNWKLYFPDYSVFYNLGSGQYWMFDFPIKSTLIRRNADNYTTKFDWYGIY